MCITYASCQYYCAKKETDESDVLLLLSEYTLLKYWKVFTSDISVMIVNYTWKYRELTYASSTAFLIVLYVSIFITENYKTNIKCTS